MESGFGSGKSNYSFVTFLHGPRGCIGEKFARAELRALVAAFVGNFEIEVGEPGKRIKPGGTITSKPIGGLKVKLRAVEWE
jgi:cytochrome P450